MSYACPICGAPLYPADLACYCYATETEAAAPAGPTAIAPREAQAILADPRHPAWWATLTNQIDAQRRGYQARPSPTRRERAIREAVRRARDLEEAARAREDATLGVDPTRQLGEHPAPLLPFRNALHGPPRPDPNLCQHGQRAGICGGRCWRLTSARP